MSALVPLRIFFFLDFRDSSFSCAHRDLLYPQGHLAPKQRNSVTIVLAFSLHYLSIPVTQRMSRPNV